MRFVIFIVDALLLIAVATVIYNTYRAGKEEGKQEVKKVTKKKGVKK